jgi:N6-L-threonylcarbamoyladenine synthase
MTIIGETTDDAVGEAFDKSAKYWPSFGPGWSACPIGKSKAFVFTNLKFRFELYFSGLKQPYCILYKRKVRESWHNGEQMIYASIQYTIVEILMDKLKLAVKKPELIKSLSVVVSAILELEKP